MENLNENQLIEKYKLPKEEHDKILEVLKEELFADKDSEERPSAVFVVGQPGCGKTTFIKNTNFSNYTIINSDDYRSFNKYSKEILDKYPTDYAKLTNFDAHLWGDELFTYAIQNGYSVLREKAPTDYSLLEVLKTIPSSYDVIIDVVVAGNLSSLMATRERYEQEILQSNHAKLSNIEAHNKCYSLLPSFISECLSCGVRVNYITFVDGYHSISVNENNLNLLQELQDASNTQACFDYEARMSNIKNSMNKRNASQKQYDGLKKIDDIHSEIINNQEQQNYKK